MTSARPNPPSSGLPIGGIIGIAVLALIGLALLVYALSNVFANPAPAASATPADLGPTATATSVIVLPTTTAPPPTAAPSATSAVVDTPAATDAPAGDVTPTISAATENDLFVLVVAANVRSAPSPDAELLGTIDGGSSADVIGRNEAGDWLAINFNGVTGWVSTQVASYLGDASTLPVMTSNAPAPTTAAAGTPAATATSQPGAAPATPAASGDVVTANPGGANVRSGPGTNYEVIGGIDANKTATVKGRNANSDWFAIDFNGTTGWVYSGVVTYSGTIATLPVVAATPAPSGSSGSGGTSPTAAPTTAPAAATATTAPANSGPIATGAGSRGITGRLEIDGGRLTYSLNERIWFWEEMKNTTAGNIQYGILGVEAQRVTSGSKILQTSWSALSGPLQIDAGCTGPTDRCGGRWRDGMNIGVAGQYQLRLVICYNLTIPECNQAGAQWEYLTDAILVTIQ